MRANERYLDSWNYVPYNDPFFQFLTYYWRRRAFNQYLHSLDWPMDNVNKSHIFHLTVSIKQLIVVIKVNNIVMMDFFKKYHLTKCPSLSMIASFIRVVEIGSSSSAKTRSIEMI